MNQFLWEELVVDGQLTSKIERSPGLLQALCRGKNQEPGASPSLWRYYTKLNDEGWLTKELRAEHLCLVAFGMHQQGTPYGVHRKGVGFGTALRQLRDSGRFSPEAVERRVQALATANNLDEVGNHLITLIDRMKSTKLPIALDYTQLYKDLVSLQYENLAGRIRRRWGGQFYSTNNRDKETKK